jgi:multiple sugar transport system substrate-binding protein
MNKSILYRLFVVLMLSSLILAACQTSEATETTAPEATEAPMTEETEAPTQATTGEKVTIRLTTWAGVDESAELQAVLDKINADSDTFQIIHEPAPDDYYTKLQTTLAGGTAADLMWLSQEYIAGYADQGAILDITDYLAADTENPAANLEDYFPEVLQTAQYQGRTYGLPWIAQPVVMYVNRALFEEAGVDLPTMDWTWDDLKEAAAALTKDTDGDGTNDQWGFTMNGWPPIHMFIWQAGGEVISEDLKSSPIDSPEAIQGAQFYADMIYDDVHTPPEAVISEQGFGEMFKAGKIAMFMGGAADDLDRVEGLDVSVVAVPAGPANRQTFAWTASTVIAAQTENPDLAYEALVKLTEGIHHWKIVAPRISLATAEVIAASEPRKADSAAAIAEAVPYMRSFRIIPRHQEWDTTFWEDFQDLLFHDQGTAEELATKARQELETVLP